MNNLKDSIIQSPSDECQIFKSLYIKPQTLKTYRFFALFAMTIICFWTFRNLYEFRYLTRWGEVIVQIYFALIVSSYFVYKDQKVLPSNNPFALWKMAHLFGVIAFTLQLFIPLLYWAWVIETNALKDRKEILLTITTHAVTAALIWIDATFNRLEYYRKHAIFLFGFCTLYAIVNYVVSKVVGDPVYKALNWQGIDSIFKLLSGYFIVYLGFVLGWFIAKRKSQKVSKDQEEKYHNIENIEAI